MEEGPENGKESLHSAHPNGMNEGVVLVIFESYAATSINVATLGLHHP